MKMNTIRRAALLAGGFALCLASFPAYLPEKVSAQAPACVQFAAPEVTHGFTRTNSLPNGDQFLLGTSLQFTVTSTTDGAAKFTVNNTTFGGNPGFPGTTLEGLSASTPNRQVTAVSCLEDFWDVYFYIATKGSTNGDMVTLFLQNTDGSKRVNLAMFTITGGNAQLVSLDSNVTLHLNDRFALGPNSMTPAFNNLAPFSVPAGDAGNRTQLLTLAFSMDPNAVTMGCWQLGFDIKRGSGTGMTSLVFNDVAVNRNEVAGDRNRPQAGLLGGLTGGFPTGVKCSAGCPACPIAGGKCHTVCFQSDEFFRTRFECLAGNTYLCSINIVVPGVNFNRPVNVCRFDDEVRYALRGGSLFSNNPRNAYWLFVQQYVALQLGLELSASGPAKFDALWGVMSCYNVPPGTFPVTLSNGVTISGDSMLKELFMQAQFALRDNRVADMEKLGQLFLALNGSSFGYSTCNSVGQFR
ncbi:MAG TPA: hypothetical protein VNQ79_02625 [Blastocatellia bacterium]|nr:hypothetical protein [Blastocatellia bacterium]